VVLLVVAGAAVPTLPMAYTEWRRAQVSNVEASALRDLRAILAAEVAYASVNGGFFDEPRCLANPAKCLKGDRVVEQVFLDSQRAAFEVRNGYAWSFHPGRAAAPNLLAAGAISPTSVSSYAILARPKGWPGAVRSFCMDFSGQFCYWLGVDKVVSPDNGRCPAEDCLVMG
jgi:hypothetical protein